MNALFEPLKTAAFDLSHRVVLAPMSRYRCDARMAPTPLVAEYYAQRTSPGGLVIVEATHINAEGTPVWNIYESIRDHGGESPGIWTDEQTEAFRLVTDAVHARGGVISCQLQHCGRVAQDDMKDHVLVGGTDLPLGPVSASAVAISPGDDPADNYSWDEPAAVPRALTIEDIARVRDDYAHAAHNALRAGFDFVELHAGHGYLISQFLCDSVNQRSDRYGGSTENRCRLLFEVVETLVAAVGPDRVGVRLSPTFAGHIKYFDVWDSDPETTYTAAIEGLNDFPLAYLLLTEPRAGGLAAEVERDPGFTAPLSSARFRRHFRGTLIAAGGFTPLSARQAIAEGHYDLIGFGRWFLSNPDLPERVRLGAPLNVYDRSTFYGGGAAGYTDYPDLAGSIKATRSYSMMEQGDIGVTLR